MTTPDPIQAAAQWLAETPERRRPHPIMSFLRKEFGLSTREAIEAIRESRLIKARAL